MSPASTAARAPAAPAAGLGAWHPVGPGGRPGASGAPSLARALATFTAAGLVALVLLAGLGTAVLERIGASEALREAQDTSELVRRALQPDLTDALVAGDPDALAALRLHVAERAVSEQVRAVKVWAPDGRVVFADAPEVVGRRFPLDSRQRTALETGGPTSRVTRLDEPENELDEVGPGPALEVYRLTRTPSGQPLLFETYLRYDSVTASGRRLWTAFAPALVVALVVLELLQLPLALQLTRRLRQHQADRDELDRRAAQAAEVARRRLASDLHDGVVQSLAGVSLWLASVQDEVRASCSPEIAHGVEVAARTTRRGITELRTLLVDISPASLRTAGLAEALADLLAPLPARGLTALPDLPAGPLELPEAVEQLLYRTAQEAVRNVLAHAGASTVEVRLRAEGDQVLLEVRDDGRGLLPPDDDRPRLGLRLLTEAAHEAGGTLSVTGSPAGGTVLRLELPRGPS